MPRYINLNNETVDLSEKPERRRRQIEREEKTARMRLLGMSSGFVAAYTLVATAFIPMMVASWPTINLFAFLFILFGGIGIVFKVLPFMRNVYNRDYNFCVRCRRIIADPPVKHHSCPV